MRKDDILRNDFHTWVYRNDPGADPEPPYFSVETALKVTALVTVRTENDTKNVVSVGNSNDDGDDSRSPYEKWVVVDTVVVVLPETGPLLG